MALSYKQAQLVKGTIPQLRKQGEQLSSVFYTSMLRDHPELRNYFNNANLANGSQPRALTALILAFASNISEISEIAPKLERVAHRHASLGIRPEHYATVGRYLIRAFEDVLGSRVMTVELRQAWTRAYWVLANMLAGREAQLYQSFGKWNAWRPFVVKSRKAETREGNIVSLVLEPLDGAPLPFFHPGQYVSIRVPVPSSDCATQQRHYSLSSAYSPDFYRLTIKRIDPPKSQGRSSGSYSQRRVRSQSSRNFYENTRPTPSRGSSITNHSSDEESNGSLWPNSSSTSLSCSDQPGRVSSILVDDTREGEVIEMSHPAGDFYLDIDNAISSTPLVLISCGVGAAPLMCMLQTVLARYPHKPIAWVQGSGLANLPYADEVRHLELKHSSLHTSFFNANIAQHEPWEAAPRSAWRGEPAYALGWLDPADLFLSDGSAEYYICGGERFMMDVSTFLQRKGVPSSRIRYELHATGFFESSV